MEKLFLKSMKIKNLLNFFKSNWLIVIAVLLAFVLRVWNLGSIPPALTPDEASLGYNAYSILKTGKDEFGKTLPIIFKSFGDFKPGLYVYISIPFIAVFGLSEFSVRLPSVLFGTLSVYLIYLIVKKVFKDREELKFLAVISSFVMAVNPYTIYFSRGAWESNVSLGLTLLGIYFFLKALENSKCLLYSSLFFALTLLTYQGAKLSSFIVLSTLIVVYWKEFWKIKRVHIVLSFVLGIVISLPVILSLFNGQTQRLSIFSIFSYPRPESEIKIYSDGYFNLFHSNQLNYLRMILTRWFNFYSGEFLFFDGDLANPVHTPPYQGVTLLIDLFLLSLGFFVLFKEKIGKGGVFFLFWLILAPLSAAISRDQTNAVRCLNASVPMVVMISLAVSFILQWIKERKFSFLYYILFFGFYLFSFVYFLDAYFIHLPVHNASFWRYGYREAVNYVVDVQDNYTNVFFEQSFNQPYIYFLFYGSQKDNQKYSPSSWQSQARLVESEYKGDVGYQEKMNNIRFEKLDWSLLRNTHNTLVVVSHNAIPPEIKDDNQNFPIVKQIKYPDGNVAFDVIELK